MMAQTTRITGNNEKITALSCIAKKYGTVACLPFYRWLVRHTAVSWKILNG